jgi:hypothetical protein
VRHSSIPPAKYIGTSSAVGSEPDAIGNPKAEPGFSIWIEHGKWFTAPTVDSEKFGGHAYDGGGYEAGIRECICGCHMGGSSSSGPVDPFGPCPLNPRGPA